MITLPARDQDSSGHAGPRSRASSTPRDDDLGAMRGIAIAVPLGLALWALIVIAVRGIVWLVERWLA